MSFWFRWRFTWMLSRCWRRFLEWLLQCVDAKWSLERCVCTDTTTIASVVSGAREGKLKRRPLVVGNAVDNKIICSAPRSNKNSAKSHPDPKKTGFFCSDELILSVLVVSDFFYLLSIQSQVEKGAYTALVSQLGSDGGARVLVESKVQGQRQIFSGESSTILLEYVFYTKTAATAARASTPMGWRVPVTPALFGLFVHISRSVTKVTWRMAQGGSTRKNKAAALPVGKMTSREIAGMRTQHLVFKVNNWIQRFMVVSCCWFLCCKNQRSHGLNFSNFSGFVSYLSRCQLSV